MCSAPRMIFSVSENDTGNFDENLLRMNFRTGTTKEGIFLLLT